jgi:hypothetical protein
MAILFSIIYGNGKIIPTDELHHFSEGLVETTNQLCSPYCCIFNCTFAIAIHMAMAQNE